MCILTSHCTLSLSRIFKNVELNSALFSSAGSIPQKAPKKISRVLRNHVYSLNPAGLWGIDPTGLEAFCLGD